MAKARKKPLMSHAGGKGSKRKIDQAERRASYLKLRKEGWTYARIGQKYDITGAAVCAAVMTELRKIPKEEADTLRNQIKERYYDLYLAGYGLLQKKKGKTTGDIKTGTDIILKANEALRKMFGLDAPQQADYNLHSDAPLKIVFEAEKVPEITKTESEDE